MAERDDLQKQYAYHEMSNKVEQADRRKMRRGEPTGEVESLRTAAMKDGHLPRMGDRVLDHRQAKQQQNKTAAEQPPKKKAKRTKDDAAAAALDRASSKSKATGPTILELGNLTGYQPSTDQAKAAYDGMLTILSGKNLLGNQNPQVLRDAAEEVLTLLHDESTTDPTKHQDVSRLLTGQAANDAGAGGLSSTVFTNLVRLSKDMDDYGQSTAARASGDNRLDDDMGVAVMFDESEDEENKDGDSDVDVDVVIDASSSSDEGEDKEEEPAGGKEGKEDDDDEDDKIVQGEGAQKKKARSADRTLSVHEIDAHFLQRQLTTQQSSSNDNPQSAQELAQQVLEILNVTNGLDVRDCENRLILLLGLEYAAAIHLWLRNRTRVWACVTLKQAATDEARQAVATVLQSTPEGQQVWNEWNARDEANHNWTRRNTADNLATKKEETGDGDETKPAEGMDVDDEDQPPEDLDLDLLAFKDGAHMLTNKACTLPDQSWRAMKKGYEEVHVPAVRSVMGKDEVLIPIADLPSWTHASFGEMEQLNRVQSKVCDIALKSSENMLLCAPTGAGKTNVAWLAMLNVLAQYRGPDNPDDGAPTFDVDAFKIVYVAPMKALVQEQVQNFSQRLKSYPSLTVRELSGDASLSRHEIAQTQVLVTTPEKLDVVTRQGEGRALFTQAIKLVIWDEIHLLHDERGPVLESLVARMLRQVEATNEPIRLVGLSATLPNYRDVAALLRVNLDKGLFFFDSTFRPVPLQMQYLGITETNAFRRLQLQNELCYTKALEQRQAGDNPVLIFVHSRLETAKTAKALQALAAERQEGGWFVKPGSATYEILREEAASNAQNADLKALLPSGLAIHHAGMTRADRELVEDLFAERHIAVLCTTATLAWGVNLPARAVIIKGTQMYNPSKGAWVELSPLDILQMLGRAGRPQYDDRGEGIIVTQHDKLQYYLSLTNLQLPVQSQLIASLPDHLNAEIALGSVTTLDEAVEWLGYTFLYVRMLQNPETYGMDPAWVKQHDPKLRLRRRNLAHSAATILEQCHLIQYHRRTGALQATALGRVASQYYLTARSMAVYHRHLRPNLTDIDLLRLFSLSGEFQHVRVRQEEKLELTKLAGRVPIPVKENPTTEASAKVNVLLQAYISRLSLQGFALAADMAFVRQSAARLMRALFEMALRRQWSHLAQLCLDWANRVSSRVWKSQSPLRQFPNVPELVARKLERSDVEWDRYPDLTATDLGELVGVPKLGKALHQFVQQYPRIEVSAHVQPLTRSLLRVEATLTPAFVWDVEIHGYTQQFHVLVEDVNGEVLLHSEVWALSRRQEADEHVLSFTVPLLDPLPPAYFLRVKSDTWLHSATVLPISFATLLLPSKFPPPTELLDLQPLRPSQALPEAALAKLFAAADISEFNPIQTQTFHPLFQTDRNCLVLAPSGTGKTLLCGLFAILRLLSNQSEGVAVYVAPLPELAQATYDAWQGWLGTSWKQPNLLAKLTSDTTADLAVFTAGEARIVVATVEQWDRLTRRWRQRAKALKTVSVVIFDDLHFLGGPQGPVLEIVISRTRFMSRQWAEAESKDSIRLVGLGASMANARDVGDWMGVPSKSLFNFSPRARPSPLEIYFQAFDQSHQPARLLAMGKPVYTAVSKHLQSHSKRTAIVFVPSRRQAQLTAIDLVTHHGNRGHSSFGDSKTQEVLTEKSQALRETALQHVLPAGVGFVHGGMAASDWNTVLDLYDKQGLLKILVCPAELCWKIHSRGHLVVIMGTQAYDGRERRHVDYSIADMIRMMGRTPAAEAGCQCVVQCHSPRKQSLKKLLYDPLPVESHLDSYLHDPLNAEIVSKSLTSLQDAMDYLTWTFLYRRLPQNPTYYGLRGTSPEDLAEHLSEMIETIVGDLEESKCCKMTETGDVSPLNLGMIAAYYYVQYRTIELMASSLAPRTKIRGVLEILSASWEFASLPLRLGEENLLKQLARRVPHPPPDGTVYDANTKALVLLQCHFGRLTLPPEFGADQKEALLQSATLIQAIVDVVSSSEWLKPALAAMELSQMVVQGLWNKDHALKQIPHFDEAIVHRCLAYKGQEEDGEEETIESVLDILTLDDDVRNSLLQLSDDQMADVAVFCNNYPNIDVSYKVVGAEDVTSGDPVEISVTLERELDDDLTDEELANIGKVSAPLFPDDTKRESWWIVIGDASANSLLALKRATAFRQSTTVKLEFLAPSEPGDYNLSLFCMSDSYLGCDQEYAVTLSVGAAVDDDSSSSSEENDKQTGSGD